MIGMRAIPRHIALWRSWINALKVCHDIGGLWCFHRRPTTFEPQHWKAFIPTRVDPPTKFAQYVRRDRGLNANALSLGPLEGDLNLTTSVFNLSDSARTNPLEGNGDHGLRMNLAKTGAQA